MSNLINNTTGAKVQIGDIVVTRGGERMLLVGWTDSDVSLMMLVARGGRFGYLNNPARDISCHVEL